MLPAERRQYILDKLYKNKAVEVNDLAKELEVTPMTIRRDLQLLEDSGLVEKSHGGAILTESVVKEATYRNRKLVHITEKRRIAKAALSLIEPSMSIYMDAGTTNYELATLIAEQHWSDLTIVTNDLAIAQLLSSVAGVRVLMAGGTIDAESAATCGVFATSMVKSMHFDICILGTQAITPDWRIMSANVEKIGVKRASIAASDKVVLLADHSKFNKHKLYYLFDLWEADILVTDYRASEAEKNVFTEHDVEYIQI